MLISCSYSFSQSIVDRTVNVTLTTAVTAAAILRSKPFDGDALFLRVQPFGFSDVSNISNTELLEVELVEAPDIVKPELLHATVNYAIGRLSIYFNEFMYYNATLEGPRCDLCSSSGDASSEAACTGLTGNTYTAAKCVGGAAAADPYTADTNGKQQMALTCFTSNTQH